MVRTPWHKAAAGLAHKYSRRSWGQAVTHLPYTQILFIPPRGASPALIVPVYPTPSLQVYVQHATAKVLRPVWELKGFTKVTVPAGGGCTVQLDLGHRAMAYYDVTQQGWLAEAGEYVVGVGRSSQDLVLQAAVTLTRDLFVPK